MKVATWGKEKKKMYFHAFELCSHNISSYGNYKIEIQTAIGWMKKRNEKRNNKNKSEFEQKGCLVKLVDLGG